MSVFQPSSLPDDAVEVGRVLDAWGVKGWIKVLPHSNDPLALLQAKTWWLEPPQEARLSPSFSAFKGSVSLSIDESKLHADVLVAQVQGVGDRNTAESLKGARIFLPRTDFPATASDEYYWVDLIGLEVYNRQGQCLGRVRDLMATGPTSVLVLASPEPADAAGDSPRADCLIPFVSAYVDAVDLPGRRINVDWQLDY
jgi:16S rRNA processing protein RimM